MTKQNPELLSALQEYGQKIDDKIEDIVVQ
jgi:hypothetical protein